MNRFFTLIAVIMLSNAALFAQKSGALKINLRTDPTISPKKRLFAIDTVIDARPDTVNFVGTLQDINGKTSELRLKDGFQPTLSNFLLTSLPGSANTLPVYGFAVEEFTLIASPETIRFELAVSFRKHSPGPSFVSNENPQLYKAELIIESSAKTITDVLKQGIATAFLKFNNYLAAPSSTPPVYSDFEQETARAVHELNLNRATYDSLKSDTDNLLRANELRAGIYQNFNELRSNRPSLTGGLAIREKKEFANLLKPSGSATRQRFYGFCDGKNLFISTRLYNSGLHPEQYAKVKNVGRYLIWLDEFITQSDINKSLVWGAVGGLFSVATKQIVLVTRRNLPNDIVALDMQTGGVFLVTGDKLSRMLENQDDLIDKLEDLLQAKQ